MLSGVKRRQLILFRLLQGVDGAPIAAQSAIRSGFRASQCLFDLCEMVRVVIGDSVELGFQGSNSGFAVNELTGAVDFVMKASLMNDAGANGGHTNFETVREAVENSSGPSPRRPD